QAQMQFPNALKATRGDLTDDEVYNTFDLALSSIETALEGALAQLRDVAPTFVTLAARENRRLELLKEHVDLARSANQDSAKAGEACAKIGAHLKRDLPRINSLLTENAEAMDLTRLGDLFSTISAIISIPRPNKLLFQKEAEACRTVNDDLVQHIHLHNQWQKVDVQLWAAESALLQVVAGGDAEIFAEVWQDIEADLQQLTGADAATPWAVQITAGLAGVPPMIAAGSWQPLASKFDRLARDIRKQFLEVDKGLKTRAEQISELGKPLDPFLALIP
ncbi:MAG: hypothetical protein NTV80_00040, partial [Verrucomicrobia bacterium]|nr:hypothetical protein [Verrucomicrobiota bacterium]